MNFFFGLKNNYFESKLTIPKFNNDSKYRSCLVFSAKPECNKWIIQKVECEQDEHFYFVENKLIQNDNIFFLAHENEIESSSYLYLDDFAKKNNFTDTIPSAFRANLKIYTTKNSFSSYQSEYPYSMTKKTGNILSAVSILLDNNADKNFIFFRNIYFLPNKFESKIFFLNVETKKILKVQKVINNSSNEIEIDSSLIKKNVYLFSECALGIPLYISIKNNHISFEHTHPPHHYILSENKFEIVGKLKKEFKEIVNENS